MQSYYLEKENLHIPKVVYVIFHIKENIILLKNIKSLE